MKNNALNTFAKHPFMFFLVIFLTNFTLPSNAQSLFRVAAVSNMDIAKSIAEVPMVDSEHSIKSEGSYLIKNGELDEIYSLKFVLPSTLLKASSTNSIIGEEKITFEQTHVMVLPIMKMVHFVGTLTIGDISSQGSFQLEFIVNDDQSITFKGGKAIKLIEYYPNSTVKMIDEVKLDINFVLKNSKNNLAVLTAK